MNNFAQNVNFNTLHKQSSLRNEIQNIDEKVIKVCDNLQKYKYLSEFFKNKKIQNRQNNSTSLGKLNSLTIDEVNLLGISKINNNSIKKHKKNSLTNCHLFKEMKNICKRVYSEEKNNSNNNFKNDSSIYIDDLYPNYYSNYFKLYELGLKKKEKTIPFSVNKKINYENKNYLSDSENEENHGMTDTTNNFDNNKYISFSHDSHKQKYIPNNKYDYSRYAIRNGIINHPKYCTLKKFQNIKSETLPVIQDKKKKVNIFKRNRDLSELIPCKNTASNLRRNFYMYLMGKQKYHKIFKAKGNDN